MTWFTVFLDILVKTAIMTLSLFPKSNHQLSCLIPVYGGQFRKEYIFKTMRHFWTYHRIYSERQVRKMKSSLRTDEEIEEIYNRHIDTVYRVCFSFMKNTADTEDIVQETFLKLIMSGKKFQSAEHEKAWLIVTASNACKDALKDWRRKTDNIENYLTEESSAVYEEDGIRDVIFSLPVKYKDVVYMYYYEGYSTHEIAKILHCSDSTIRNRLSRARKLFKKYLGGERNDKRNYGFL